MVSVPCSHTAQDTKSATDFYEAKVKELAGNIQGLEGIVQAKTNNLRVVEEGSCCYSIYHSLSRCVKAHVMLMDHFSSAAKGAGSGFWGGRAAFVMTTASFGI